MRRVTQGAATSGLLKLQHDVFADMDVNGSDANKSYVDQLVTGYDSNSQPIYNASQKSFSSTWFVKQTGNQTLSDYTSLSLTNGYMPSSNSPVLTAASFDGLGSWFSQVSYIGAFASGDNWMTGWTNFDPENTDY